MANILVLWSHHSGYLHGCLQELSRHADVIAVFFEPAEEAPFSKDYFSDANYSIVWINRASNKIADLIAAKLVFFRADLCLCSGWHHHFYLHYLSSSLKDECIRVLCFDWQWTPIFRNYLKALYGSLYRSKLFHACFVPGERQFQFAKRVGFRARYIYQGLYSASPNSSQWISWGERRNRIVFIGRLVESKGCAQLAAAWNKLQANNLASSSWSLDIFGVGPLEPLFLQLNNCNLYGFLQPGELAMELASSKILCAPSLVEPWGVQIHEATLAGLAVVASDACGSAVHLVKSGFNGEIVPNGDITSLSSSLDRLTQLDEPVYRALEKYGSCSRLLSGQYSPMIWANTVMNMLACSSQFVTRA
jgi:glycosyltransferase involved in cell wall biosynthesis